MRRIDAITLSLGLLVAGGLIYGALQIAGLDGQKAGIWSQVFLLVGLLGWLATYFLRVVTQKMTYNQQLTDYEDAVLQKQLEEMSPEERAALQAEIDQEKA